VTRAPDGAPRDELDLEERLSRPSPSLPRVLACVAGDIIILGAGGKMGPSLAHMARRADPDRRIIAVSRWSNARTAKDLLDPRALATLPNAPNVVFMAGQKFGTSDSPSSTWAMNAAVPAFVSERYAGARIVVFSTGNVYPLTAPDGGGSCETDSPQPIGEYAYSCLARERLFTASARRHGSPVANVRLNYAHDLRYGVLTDLATRIARGEPVRLGMSFVNVIWQGDANALALASLAPAAAPEPFIVNVAGPDILRVADLARRLGSRLGVEPVFSGDERASALLSNASRMRSLTGDPLLPLDTLLDWTAAWVRAGGRLLGKPTGFEQRDGRF